MTNTTSANWTPINEGALHGYTLGSTDSTTYYYANSNLNFYSIDAGVSGLTILGTVYIYIPSGKSLSCFGADANGTMGAGAGIELTSGNALYLLSNGNVNATGGNAANGSNGSNGTDAAFEYDQWVRVGGGGNGGNGGGGAGAGIGTRGGNGSAGAQGASAETYTDWSEHNGQAGSDATNGGTAGAMGNLYVVTTIQLLATGGIQGTSGAKGGNTVAGTVKYILATDGSGNYPIYNANDWDVFAAQVSNGTTFQGKTMKLMADISVSTMVGAGIDSSFMGSFDGQGHTLTFTKGTASEPFNEEHCAPFRYVKAATIKNLKVNGSIYTSQKFAAGLVAYNDAVASGIIYTEGTSITNCLVSTVIYSSVNGDGSHGGFLADYDACWLNIQGCTYTGRLLTNNGTTSCGGFVGLMSCESYFSDALYAPSGSIPAGWTAITDGATIARGSGTQHITNCYFSETLGTVQGAPAYSITPGTDITVVNAGYTDGVYGVSGLTFYATGLKYDGVLYAANGNNVKLTIESNRTGYVANGFQAGAGTISGSENPYTLTMPDGNVTINATSWSQILQTDVNGDYLIGSTNDWVTFCEMMNQGISNFNGKTVKLTADINVSTVAAPTAANQFQGTFLGGGHTITATITDTINQGTALFRYINGATIQDLKLAGTINAKNFFPAALVGFSNGTNSIKNCVVTANVNALMCVGGLVGNASGSDISFSGCVFSGMITSFLFPGVFIAAGNGGTKTITDCLYIMPDGQNTASLDLVKGTPGTLTISRCYKTAAVGSQGTKVRSLTGATGVTVSNISPVGDSIATYNVSGITAYDKGITCGETFYYGNGDEVNLNLSCNATIPVEYCASAGTLAGNDNPYTLTMPDSDVVINVKSLFAVEAGKWYVISTPMHDQGETFESVSQVENLTSDSYDLFRYNETTAKWENQKAGDGATGFDNLLIGRGHIYRCSDDRTLTFNGELNYADTYSVYLTATDSVGELKGFSIVGNPYPFRVHLARDYYSLNPDGTCSEHYYPHSDSLEVGQGALVYTANGEILTFYASTRSTNVGTKGLPPLPKGFRFNDNNGPTDSSQDNDNGVEQESHRPFAYVSGNQLIVEGSGTLQVYDVIGRLIFRENVSTYQPINVSKFPQTGVYILLLNGQSQKIIIR